MTDLSTLLMWTNQDPKYPNSFIIKTDKQKLLGLVRTDKNGQIYWKFKERGKKVKPETESRPVMDNIQKFQQRQNQACLIQDQLNHGKTDNSEQSTVNSSQ